MGIRFLFLNLIENLKLKIEIFLLLNKRIAIDLGTSNSRVYLAGKGLVFSCPTVCALRENDGRVVAIGEAAKKLLGRAPEGIAVIRPVENGAICDWEISEKIIEFFLNQILGAWRLFKPEVMLVAPAGITQVEKRALLDAAFSAGAKNVWVIDQPVAAAIGAKISLADPAGSLIVSLGGGCSEAAILSLGAIVSYDFSKTGGDKIDQTVANYLRKKHNVTIGINTAEKIKNTIGSALPTQEKNQELLDVNTKDALSGIPKTIHVDADEITDLISKNLQEIIGLIKHVFENAPSELSSDIADKGIVITGGLAKLKNLNKFIMQTTGLACHVAMTPDTSAIAGAGYIMENMEELGDLVKK